MRAVDFSLDLGGEERKKAMVTGLERRRRAETGCQAQIRRKSGKPNIMDCKKKGTTRCRASRKKSEEALQAGEETGTVAPISEPRKDEGCEQPVDNLEAGIGGASRRNRHLNFSRTSGTGRRRTVAGTEGT